MARIRKSRALTAHLIHAKTEQVLHLSSESGYYENTAARCRGGMPPERAIGIAVCILECDRRGKRV